MDKLDSELAKKAIENKKIFNELLVRILSKEDEIRYPSFKILLVISEEYPEVLYPKWDFLADLLKSNNSYKKLIALRLIANLTKADTENKFEEIFDDYYEILNEDKTMTAAHLAGNSGKIAKAKSNLQSKITDKLVNIDNTYRGRQKELIKSYIIEAFDEYYEVSEDKEKIIEFVKKQLDSDSPKTKKKAEEFLKKWGIK